MPWMRGYEYEGLFIFCLFYFHRRSSGVARCSEKCANKLCSQTSISDHPYNPTPFITTAGFTVRTFLKHYSDSRMR